MGLVYGGIWREGVETLEATKCEEGNFQNPK